MESVLFHVFRFFFALFFIDILLFFLGLKFFTLLIWVFLGLKSLHVPWIIQANPAISSCFWLNEVAVDTCKKILTSLKFLDK